MVSALAWPMKKKLDWLKIKFRLASQDLAVVSSSLSEVHALINSLVAEREDLHRSCLLVEKDKVQ